MLIALLIYKQCLLKILVQTKEACCSETLIFPTCAIKRKEKIEVMLDSTVFYGWSDFGKKLPKPFSFT